MPASRQTPWQDFKENPDPLARIRELKRALPDGPGLPSLYAEVKGQGSVLGIPVLAVGRNIFVSRLRVVEKIEGRDGQMGA